MHGYEVDSGGVLAPVALARYLLDMASQHAAEIGCGVDTMIERGMTWVLSRLRVSVTRPIVLGEVLTVRAGGHAYRIRFNRIIRKGADWIKARFEVETKS